MDLNISREFFDPDKIKNSTCNIIGCGSIGSNVAELLVRQGVENITLWDDDIVESHNLVNQLFTTKHENKLKVEALTEILHDINPIVNITIYPKKYTNQALIDFVFICVDSIDVRKEILKENQYNNMLKFITDFRTSLTEGQIYSLAWNYANYEYLLKTMNFTHEEAGNLNPITACGFNQSIAPTVKMTACQGIANFTQFINNQTPHKLTVINPYQQKFIAL